ncbi:lasso peptide microcin J25, partial [Escherichia coli]|nr:lasso peptide microcin J25 [Escherichia coli]EHL9236612.1 lasso peptide microcin J25 [Escherichia coli]HCQ3016867.1 lasso peptide microcin J25 [Escherichia coli]
FHFNKLSSGKKNNVPSPAKGVIQIKKSASQLTKGGAGHVPEYFVGIGTPISFYG